MPTLKKGQNLPLEDHVVRHVKARGVMRDQHGNAIGIFPHAFALRPDEPGISVSWCEYYGLSHVANLQAVIDHLRVARDVTPKAGFVAGQVSEIKAAAKNHNRDVRIYYLPTNGNPAHSVVSQFANDDIKIMEEWASRSWSQFIPAS